MHQLLQTNVILDFIWMLPVELSHGKDIDLQGHRLNRSANYRLLSM